MNGATSVDALDAAMKVATATAVAGHAATGTADDQAPSPPHRGIRARRLLAAAATVIAGLLVGAIAAVLLVALTLPSITC